MNVDMVLAGAQFVCMLLSFTLLLGARRLSVGLCSTAPSYQRLPTRSDVQNPLNLT